MRRGSTERECLIIGINEYHFIYATYTSQSIYSQSSALTAKVTSYFSQESPSTALSDLFEFYQNRTSTSFSSFSSTKLFNYKRYFLLHSREQNFMERWGSSFQPDLSLHSRMLDIFKFDNTIISTIIMVKTNNLSPLNPRTTKTL